MLWRVIWIRLGNWNSFPGGGGTAHIQVGAFVSVLRRVKVAGLGSSPWVQVTSSSRACAGSKDGEAIIQNWAP